MIAWVPSVATAITKSERKEGREGREEERKETASDSRHTTAKCILEGILECKSNSRNKLRKFE